MSVHLFTRPMRVRADRQRMSMGFTVFELLVVLAILGMVSIFVLAGFRAGSRRIDLVLAAERVALDIRRAQQFAVTTRQQQSGAAAVSPCGYGIYIDDTALPATGYMLFAEVSQRDEDDPLLDCAGAFTFDDEETESVEHIRLSPLVRIAGFSAASGDIDGPLAIVFEPPAPTTVFTGGTTVLADPWVQIVLSLVADPAQQSIVRVYRWGQVTVTTP